MPPSTELRALVDAYRSQEIEFPLLKPITVAQWIVESGWGHSALARDHNNFAGMKWRTAMAPYATRVTYEAHDGRGAYCHFHDIGSFIRGYWAFLERAPYAGWRSHVFNGEAFISFIGPTWAEDRRYVEKVLDLEDEATALLGLQDEGDPGSHGENRGCCDGSSDTEVPPKPTIQRQEPTSHKSSRNGTDIDHIVIHYTTSRNIEGTIRWFKNAPPGERASAHYIVGRDGALVQMVDDSDAAWHAGVSTMNKRSIGIEHVAAPGDKIMEAQGKTSIALIKWLMHQYEVPKSQVIPHVCVKPTSCCGDLFADHGGGAGKPCSEQREALHAWMSTNGV